ncbi:uncharacterized protein LOC112045151 [Bicyclus anynana]|uniref:Uncharacterized protein LOC112045151 n=1 Tax=Bicyclus anynana TaxID=110368 RepID=A0ABM3LKF9_BICAN|nr:uncharacterized protein LOC112045151 [Bicyclus anynana]
MKKKNRSEVSLQSEKSSSKYKQETEIPLPALDILIVKIMNLRIADEESKSYEIVVTFFDQILLSSVIKSTYDRSVKDEYKKPIATGYLNYDPSDYEKMCLFADYPLTIKIRPLRTEENTAIIISSPNSSAPSSKSSQVTKLERVGPPKPDPGTYCCNIDILPIFIESNKMTFKKRLEPMFKPSVLLAKSWDNLPLLTITLKSIRNPENVQHQKMFKNVNNMKMTIVGCYNMILPFDDEFNYTAASQLPLPNESNAEVFTFNNGHRMPRGFNSLSFYPHWANLVLAQELFTSGDEKFEHSLSEFQNEENIDVTYYLNEMPNDFTTIWSSFHRVLLLKDTEELLAERIRAYKWPIEVHSWGESKSFSFMGFMNLFPLLYPGEKAIRLFVPLQWINAQDMMNNCGCRVLLTLNEKVPSIVSAAAKFSKGTTDSAHASTITEAVYGARPTGSDDNCSFVIVEVSLSRPFKMASIPPHISEAEMNEMLLSMEAIPTKRECTGRGQLDRDWQTTVRVAANSLRRLPYYGLTDLCTINRQLSESRGRVELVTSFWLDAVIYVNNNFVVSDFLQRNDTFEEMLLIAHACLVRLSNETLQAATDNRQELNPTLRAARHARLLQDLPHAVDLYLQLVAAMPREANSWRELGKCLKDVDDDWANVCIDKAVMLNTRHPLSLLSKGCAVFDVDPDAAEPFFTALLALYPFYTCLWVAASAYYIHRELFHMAHEIIEQVNKTEADGLQQELPNLRVWERELGDWWEQTPLAPDSSRYYDAADLLLRLRAVSLAEICIAQGFLETGESAAYYHMVALSCRIRRNLDDALCHLKQGIEKYGEFSYLKSLEGECLHSRKEMTAAMASFQKVRFCSSPYITLLSLPRRDHVRAQSILADLTRRQPSAYAWIAFADNWIMQSAMGEGGDADATLEQKTAAANATTCVLNALRCDRRAGKAWSLLASLLKPSARRTFCKEMAVLCGENKLSEKRSKTKLSMEAQQSLCFKIGTALRECRCQMCEHLQF